MAEAPDDAGSAGGPTTPRPEGVPEIKVSLDSTGGLAPLHRVLGIRMGLGVNDEGIAWFDADPQIHFGAKWVHGGSIPPLVDLAGAIVVAHTYPDAMTAVDATIEMKVNYLKKASAGPVVAVARVVHRGRRIAVADVDVMNNGNLCAKGIVTYMLRPDVLGSPDPDM